MKSVNHCVCFDVMFEDLLKIARENNITSVEDLQDIVDFGMGCHMCIPYVEIVLKTGETALDPYCIYCSTKRGINEDA